MTIGNLNQKLINCKRISYWNSRLSYTLLNATKNPTYIFIQTYTFINFQQKVPPIRLFPPILSLVFKEISHLYFYSEPSSIRNSRVHTFYLVGSQECICIYLGILFCVKLIGIRNSNNTTLFPVALHFVQIVFSHLGSMHHDCLLTWQSTWILFVFKDNY